VVFALTVAIILAVRIHNRNKKYIPLPVFITEKKFRLKDLVNDQDIRQIKSDEVKLGERIALGVGGEVIKGRWEGKEVAVKRLGIGKNQMTESFVQDFLVEIKIMSTLDNENILKFLGASISENNDILLVMEYMEKGSLRDVLLKTEGKIDWKLKLRLAIDACKGMEYLHSFNPPLIHRDIKSSNLLIDKKWRCKVADFGISRIPNSSASTTLVGTPAYMAPEVISKNEISAKADVYSFGVTLTELVTGVPPYSDTSLFPQQIMYGVVNEGLRPAVPTDCPTAMEVLIKDCLNAEPVRRPDFSEIRARLQRMQS